MFPLRAQSEAGGHGGSRKLKRNRSSKKKDEYANAVFMARQLYMLDGYKKSEVAARLADK